MVVTPSGGTLFESDNGSETINKISSTGVVTPFVTGLSSTEFFLAFDSNDTLFVTNFINGSVGISKILPTGVITPFATGFNRPRALAFGPDPISTAVPEPFTIIGTLIGGTAAFRMRKKLKAIAS